MSADAHGCPCLGDFWPKPAGAWISCCRRYRAGQAGASGQTSLDHRAGLPGTEAGTWFRSLRRTRLAWLHHHATLRIAAYGFLVAERNRLSHSARTGHLGLPAPEPPLDFRPAVRRVRPEQPLTNRAKDLLIGVVEIAKAYSYRARCVHLPLLDHQDGNDPSAAVADHQMSVGV